MITATIIGEYFLEKNLDLTDIQVQKLVYYAYSWYMVKNKGEKLFDENPEAWIHGPVFKSLYKNMKINRDIMEGINFDDRLDVETKRFLDIIYNVYGKFSGNELERMTHSESPWINARKGLESNEHSNNIISDEDIMNCYGK